MRKKIKNPISYYLIVLAILLIVVGSFIVIRTIISYEREIESEQDKDLKAIALSSDSNISNIFDTIDRELRSVAKSRFFFGASSSWKNKKLNNKTGRLPENKKISRHFIRRHTINHNSLIETVLVVRNEKVLLSSKGTENYQLNNNKKWMDAGRIDMCYRGDGKQFIAFISKVSKKEKCVALLNPERFYHRVAGNNVPSGDRIMLFNNKNNLLMVRSASGSKVYIKDSTKRHEFGQDEYFMIYCEKKGKSGAKTIDEKQDGNKDTAAGSQKRMMTLISSETKNGDFAIGVKTDHDKLMEPIKTAISNMLIFGFMVTVGISLLVVTTILNRRREEKILAEARALRKKNAEIEKMVHHQRLEMIGTMTSAVAHEFNNMMTPIMGYSMLSLEKLEKYCDKGDEILDEVYDNMLEVYNTSKRTKILVRRLSDLSRKGNLSDLTLVDLGEQLETVKALTIPAKPENVDFELDICDEKCVVMGDLIQLSQMVMNLILNAFHALKKDGGKIIVSLSCSKKEAIIIVSDNGPGIEEKNLNRIFDPFFTTKGAGVGTGLGLAIVEKIVKLHKGDITVNSKAGEGSCFTVKIPLAEDENKNIGKKED